MSSALKDEPELVWHANDVKMADVVQALGEVRLKFARAEAGDHDHAHARNCVMTLVAVSSTQAEERRAQHACRMIGALHPAQAIVIRDEAGGRGKGVDAWIVTDVQRPAMACAVECEILTLHVPGAAADHVAALVDPLLVSGVPTYLWWMGTPPFGRSELHDALRVSDALVFDSARFDEPYHAFRGLSKLISIAHRRLGLADLQWSRLRPWRETIAQFFMPFDRRPFLSGITEVGIDYAGQGRGNRIAATMITGWIASSLGWKLQRAAAGPGGVVAARYTTERRSIEVNFRSVPKEHLANGELSAIRIAGIAGGTTFRLEIMRDPDRPRGLPADPGYRSLMTSGGEDDAGIELTQRRAAWHRDVVHGVRDSLHHTSTGDPPGESRPKHPVVFTSERRRTDTQQVLLTMIHIGEGPSLRHVQQVQAEDEAVLLLDLLATGTHDSVFNRSLQAGFDLMRKM